jgi:hypothetical protein
MDRDLEIAAVSAALAIVWAYALKLRLREGYVQFRWKQITRTDDPASYWTIILVLGLFEAAFVSLAVVKSAEWLGR